MTHTRHTLVHIGVLCFFLPGLLHAQLPWRQIAEKYKYNRKLLLSEKADDVQAYSISNGLVICPLDNQKLISGPEVLRGSNSQWKLITHPVKKNEDGNLLLAVDGLEKGFYRVEVKVQDNDRQLVPEYYFLVNSDWQKEIMGICQDFKREVEIHPNAHDIGASIILSHFGNLQEKLAQSKILTGDILSRLLLAIQSKEQFERGDVPNFSKGLNKLRFKRFEGAEYTNIVIQVPNDYDPAQKWPVYVYMDSALWAANKYGDLGKYSSNAVFHPGMIDMWWHSIPSHGERLYLDLKWEEFLCVKKVMEERLSIDGDRFYLFGECWKGWLSDKYPQ